MPAFLPQYWNSSSLEAREERTFCVDEDGIAVLINTKND